MSDDGHVVGAMAGPQAGQVLLELDVEHPVELVFDAPVAAHDGVEALGREGLAEQIVAGLGAGAAADLAAGDDLADGLESGPFVL